MGGEYDLEELIERPYKKRVTFYKFLIFIICYLYNKCSVFTRSKINNDRKKTTIMIDTSTRTTTGLEGLKRKFSIMNHI